MRMIKVLKIFSVISVFIYGLVPVCAESQQNAADIYKKIFNNISSDELIGQLKDNYNKIIDEGWSEEYKNIELILNNEKENFDQFLGSFEIERCDFLENTNGEVSFKDIFPLRKIRDFTRLVCLEGRRQENLKNYSYSFKLYSTLLKFSYECITECDLISCLTTLSIQNVVYTPLLSLVTDKRLSNSELHELDSLLEKYSFSKKILINAIKNEKNTVFEQIKANFNNEGWEKKLLLKINLINPKLTEEDINEGRKWYLEGIKNKMDYYNDLLIYAIKSDSIKKIDSVYESFKDEIKPVSKIKTYYFIFLDCIKGLVNNTLVKPEFLRDQLALACAGEALPPCQNAYLKTKKHKNNFDKLKLLVKSELIQ